MNKASLTIHVIVQNRNDLTIGHNFFVYLEGERLIERLRRIISTRTNEKAMIYALTKGRIVDPGEVSASKHLILTKTGAYWDLM